MFIRTNQILFLSKSQHQKYIDPSMFKPKSIKIQSNTTKNYIKHLQNSIISEVTFSSYYFENYVRIQSNINDSSSIIVYYTTIYNVLNDTE